MLLSSYDPTTQRLLVYSLDHEQFETDTRLKMPFITVANLYLSKDDKVLIQRFLNSENYRAL